MRKVAFVLVSIAFVSFVFFSQLRLINRPVQDTDEGVYLTTFLLIHHGHPAYKQTFFSQPPGFLLSVYPGFILFGQSLQAARLTIGLWSLLSLLAIIWIGIELKNPWSGIFMLGILYLIPSYITQIITFQSDGLISAFSLISLAFAFKFMNTKHFGWFIFSIIFFNLSFWTKYDFFLIVPFLVILFVLLRNKSLKPKDIVIMVLISVVISLLFFLFFIIPFGIKDIVTNTLSLRLAASSLPTSPLSIFKYLIQDIPSLLVVIGTIIICVLRKDSLHFPFLPILVWAGTIFIVFLFYRPLFPHHMVMFIVPATLFFSLAAAAWLKIYKKIYIPIILCVLVFAIINNVLLLLKTPNTILNTEQQQLISIIDQYTQKKDSIVTDEEILYGASNRFPPPQLSDVSHVRISSGNLEPEKVTTIIQIYKPKLIIPWNGRLQSIQNFSQILSAYKPLIRVNNKIVYMRKE